MTSLRKLYDEVQRGTFQNVKDSIVEKVEGKINRGQKLPFYINGLDLSCVSFGYLGDILKQDHGIVVERFPNGIIVTDLIDTEESD